MKLRDRDTRKPSSKASSPAPSPKGAKVRKGRRPKSQEGEIYVAPMKGNQDVTPLAAGVLEASTSDVKRPDVEMAAPATKKLPRVVLKLNRSDGH